MSCFRCFRNVNFIRSNAEQLKRFAGHSKWQNIRHIKAAKDAERASATAQYVIKLKTAVIQGGGITDPQRNLSLSSVIDSAVKAHVPRETINNFLKRFETSKEVSFDYRFRGPGDCILILTYACTPQSVSSTRDAIKKILRKASSIQVTDGFQNAFETKGVIFAKLSSGKASMDDAEEIAIISGAEEVSFPEVEKEDSFRFLSDQSELWSVVKSLKENSWEVLEASLEQLPTAYVELSDEQLDTLRMDIEKLEALPEFVKIVDNIA